MMKKFIVIILVLAGCSPKYVPVKEKTFRSDTTIITERSVPVFIPGSKVTVDIDSLFDAWGQMIDQPEPKIVYLKDKANNTQLTIFYDSLRKAFVARCETLEKEAWVKVRDSERRIKHLQETIIEKEKSFGERLKDTVFKILGGVSVFIFFCVICYIVIKIAVPKIR